MHRANAHTLTNSISFTLPAGGLLFPALRIPTNIRCTPRGAPSAACLFLGSLPTAPVAGL